MKCRMCGYEFDENEIPNRGCSGCGKHGCHSVHCPNCGFGNSPELDQEFDFIIKLKDKIKNRKKGDKSCNDNNGEHTKKWTIRRYKYLF